MDVTAYVREDRRGQGVGKRIYQALFTELSALGYCQAFAAIALPTDASVALHSNGRMIESTYDRRRVRVAKPG